MTIAWTKTAGQLSAMAAQRVQMLGDGQTLTGHRWNVWKDHANGFLKLLQTQGPNEWRRSEIILNSGSTPALTAGVATYTLTPRPYSVDVVQYRDVSSRDMPLKRWNQDQYRTIPYKTTPGIPICYTVDRQRADVAITLWPVPNAAVALGAIVISVMRVINDIATPDDVVDVPQEWLDMLADVTGVRLAGSFNLANKAVDAAKERGQSALIELLGSDHDDSIVFTMESW